MEFDMEYSKAFLIGALSIVVFLIVIVGVVICYAGGMFDRFECPYCGGHEAQYTSNGLEQCASCKKMASSYPINF